MKTVKVEYTVEESFVQTNKENIQKVMEELRNLNNPDIKYASYIKEDGVSFVHFANHANEEAGKIMANLVSFKYFQAQLKNSELVSAPKPESLQLIASSFDIFP